MNIVRAVENTYPWQFVIGFSAVDANCGMTWNVQARLARQRRFRTSLCAISATEDFSARTTCAVKWAYLILSLKSSISLFQCCFESALHGGSSIDLGYHLHWTEPNLFHCHTACSHDAPRGCILGNPVPKMHPIRHYLFCFLMLLCMIILGFCIAWRVVAFSHFQHNGLCFHLAGKRTFRTPPEDDSTPNPNSIVEYEIYNPNG